MRLVKKIVNNMKLRTKLLVSYLLLVLLPMITIFLYFQYHFVYCLEDSTLQMEKIIMDQAADSIESYMSQIENTANMVAQSEIIQQLLTSDEKQLQQLMSSQRQRDAAITYMENIQSRIDGVIVQDVQIYCEPALALFKEEALMDYELFESLEKIRASLWYGNLLSKNMNSIVASAFYMASEEGEHASYISYIKKIPYYVKGEKKLAFAAVYFNRDYLMKVLDGYGDFSESCIYIMDEKDNVVASQGQTDYQYLRLTYQSIDNSIGKEKTYAKIDYGNHEAWSIYYNISQAKWKMVFTVSVDSITKSVQEDGFLLMGCYLVIALLLSVCMFLLAHSITSRVTLLKNQMVRVKQQLPEKLEIEQYYDEIGQLTDGYNDMAEKTQRLVMEKTNMLRERNQMEMNFLRSQINPHFLYNTLDMISWYAVKGNIKEVTQSIQSLAGFYRLSLNQGEILTTIENEIQLLEKYIEIQRKRTFSEIEFIVDISDEMLEKKIPQFLFQPLVENSLKHGIYEKEKPTGYIMITGWMEKKEMVLVLSDDGQGMSEEIMKNLFKEKEQTVQKGNHIGIRNLYRRLVLFYGKDGFSMEYKSKEGEGTTVELHLSLEVHAEETLLW